MYGPCVDVMTPGQQVCLSCTPLVSIWTFNVCYSLCWLYRQLTSTSLFAINAEAQLCVSLRALCVSPAQFGEISVLTNTRRTGTAIAVEDTDLIVIPKYGEGWLCLEMNGGYTSVV